MRSELVLIACLTGFAGCTGKPAQQPSRDHPRVELGENGQLTLTSRSRAYPLVLSAPLLPCYRADTPYPRARSAQEELAFDTIDPYSDLLTTCNEWMSEKTAVPIRQLTPAEIYRNYVLVGICAHEIRGDGAWFSRLLRDVDVCATTLGQGWRFPQEMDFATITDSERRAFRDWAEELAQPQQQLAKDSGRGTYYFSLRFFMRTKEGDLADADLAQAGSGAADGRIGVRCVWTGASGQRLAKPPRTAKHDAPGFECEDRFGLPPCCKPPVGLPDNAVVEAFFEYLRSLDSLPLNVHDAQQRVSSLRQEYVRLLNERPTSGEPEQQRASVWYVDQVERAAGELHWIIEHERNEPRQFIWHARRFGGESPERIAAAQTLLKDLDALQQAVFELQNLRIDRTH